jgi:hypothetical protein
MQHAYNAGMHQIFPLLTAHSHHGFLHSMIGHSVTNTAFAHSMIKYALGHSVMVYAFGLRFAERLMGSNEAWCLLKLGSDA